MSAPENLSKIDRLRARDGGRCWLCDGPIDFKAEPNTPRAPTLEHLVAKVHQGPGTLHNLVLCHPPCNRELDDLSVAEKVKMREKRREEAWKAEMRKKIAKMLVG